MLLSARVMVLSFWRTLADGSAVGSKVILPCFSVFRVSARCSFDRWPPAEVWWWGQRPSFCSPSCSFFGQLYQLISLPRTPAWAEIQWIFNWRERGSMRNAISYIHITTTCSPAYLLFSKPAVGYTGLLNLYIRMPWDWVVPEGKKSKLKPFISQWLRIDYDLDYL